MPKRSEEVNQVIEDSKLSEADFLKVVRVELRQIGEMISVATQMLDDANTKQSMLSTRVLAREIMLREKETK